MKLIKNVIIIIIVIIIKLIFGFENDLKKPSINVLFNNIIITIDLSLKYIISNKITIYKKSIIIN